MKRNFFSLFLVLALVFSLFFTDLSLCYGKRNKRQLNDESAIVATWNIGHFSKGSKPYSLISSSNFKKKITEYRSFVYDSINADILCINEYDEFFCKDSTGYVELTEKVLFDGYKNRKVFTKNTYVCNAMFANRKLKNAKMHDIEYNQIAKKDMPRIVWHYFVFSDIIIAGKRVKIVCTHLVNRAPEHCNNQIKELISLCKAFDRVIICGDFNTTNYTQFKEAGYKLANDGSIITFPSNSRALDNIIVKGLNITDVRVVKNALSDHYPLVCRISL